MAAESFFERWSRRKAVVSDGTQATREGTLQSAPESLAALDPAIDMQAGGSPPSERTRPLTQDDVEALTADSNYSVFMHKDVDETVRRSAMKKLFADPHFNVMDGLDIYIDDYSKPDPIPAAMLAALRHAKGLLDPLSQLQAPLMQLREPADTGSGADIDSEHSSSPATEQPAADALPASFAPEAAVSEQSQSADDPSAEHEEPEETNKPDTSDDVNVPNYTTANAAPPSAAT